MLKSIILYCEWRLEKGLNIEKIPTCKALLPMILQRKNNKALYDKNYYNAYYKRYRKFGLNKKTIKGSEVIKDKQKRCLRCEILLDSPYAGRHDGQHCEDCIIAINRPVDKNT